MLKYINRIILIVASSALIYSCTSTNQYKRSDDVVTNNYFRTDKLPQDSLSAAELSWKDIFTDPILQQHIDTALENNIDIRVAMENLKISEAYLKQAKASFYPTLSVGPGGTYQTNSLNTQFGQLLGDRTHIFQYDLSMSTSWEADIWGKLKIAKKAALMQYLQSTSSHYAVKSQIVSGIASLYYRLLALDEQKKTIEQTIKYREESLKTTVALKESGLLTEVAVIQTEAQLINIKTQLIEVVNSISVLENQLSLLQGKQPQPVKRSSLVEQKMPEELKTGYPVAMLSNRPDVMAAEYNLMSAYYQTNAAKKAMYPSFRITASGGLQSIDIEKLFSVNSLFANAVGSLAQPVLNQRKLKTQYQVAQRQQEMARLRFTQSLLIAGKEVSDALFAFENQSKIVTLKKSEAEAYTKAVEYSTELVNYGMANYLEVLRAEENALNAQLSMINAEWARMNAVVQLYLSLGGGWR
ncbi:MAG TPA: efflux transporter outer membrane subunit [Ferruginibacter sp.]|nr:efflux transporter outer membrane subunit [Ferruginibacter sp.]HRO17768.1 efflux transporter outer membrane subunit [Ferruginibacter sp.]